MDKSARNEPGAPMITLLRTNRLGPVTPEAEPGDNRTDQQRTKDAAAARADAALMLSLSDSRKDSQVPGSHASMPGSQQSVSQS